MTDPTGTNTAAIGGPFSPANGVPTGSNTSAGSSSAPVTGSSLIFTSASSQYLSATGKTGINQQKFTIAFWFKSTTAAAQNFFDFSDGTTTNRTETSLGATGTVSFVSATASATVASLVTGATFIDGNWHSLVIAVDTTQATNTNRLLMYVDGTLISSFSGSTYPAQNTNLSNNFAATYDIGSRQGTSRFLNGKLAQVYYIDGQQLTPSSFISGTPGNPITYTGTYTGTFDFFLSFSNGASTTTLGLDSSGEANNWTLNAMTTANQSTDYP